MRNLLTAALVMMAMPSFAECYVVDNLKGQSVREFRDFDFFEDKYTGEPLEITLAGDNSRATSLIGSCFEPKRNYVVCNRSDDKTFTFETWHILPLEKKAIWSKSRYTESHRISGASILVGDIVGKCQ